MKIYQQNLFYAIGSKVIQISCHFETLTDYFEDLVIFHFLAFFQCPKVSDIFEMSRKYQMREFLRFEKTFQNALVQE